MTIYEGSRYFWNGRVLEDGTVRGSLSILDDKGQTKDYSFKGTLAEGELKRIEKETKTDDGPVETGK
jgi:hypothetical protein